MINYKNKYIKLGLLFLSILVAGILIANPSFAQEVNINLGDEKGTASGKIISLLILVTILSIAPGILIMTTSFTRIVIVFSITRNALSTNTTPPNMVLISLAIFLTGFIMAPTFEKAWDAGIKPLINEEVEAIEGLEKASVPLKEFMVKNTRDKDLELFINLSKSEMPKKIEDTPLKIAIPSFMISELRRAFEIGFLIYIPFIIIDMIIASVLMSMGMMMLPPTMLAMPFKLIFFVVIDGWYLLAGSLVKSFATG